MDLHIESCDLLKKSSIPEVKQSEVASDYDVLPLFEKTLYTENIKKRTSMEANELLKCRWKEFKFSFSNDIKEPFILPDARDIRFHNQKCRLMPSMGRNKYTDFRYKLVPGPGVDKLGQKPIPNESLMKRGIGTGKDSKIKSQKPAKKKEN